MTTLFAIADTLTRVGAPSSELATARELLAIGSAMLAAVGALVGLGVQFGRHAEFKDSVERRMKELKDETGRRLTALETTDGHSITREEMNARFAESTALINALSERFSDFTTIVKEIIRVNRGGI